MNINEFHSKSTQKLDLQEAHMQPVHCSHTLFCVLFSKGQIQSPSKQLLMLEGLLEESFKGNGSVG